MEDFCTCKLFWEKMPSADGWWIAEIASSMKNDQPQTTLDELQSRQHALDNELYLYELLVPSYLMIKSFSVLT